MSSSYQTGRDTADMAMTKSFGKADLRNFFVVIKEEIATHPAAG
jgi:hypothetical protein